MALRTSRSPDAVADVAAESTALVEDAVRAIQAECAVALGSHTVVSAACDRLRAARAAWWIPPHPGLIATLLPLLGTRTGAVADTLFALVEDLAHDAPDPIPFVRAMLASRDTNLARRGIDVASALTVSGHLPVGRELLSEVAAVADEASPLLAREQFEPLAEWLSSSGCDLRTFYFDTEDRALRRLAGRLLDRESRPSAQIVARVLGDDAASFLLPYLDYTRATHVDLLNLEEATPECVGALRHAERVCGPALLRHAVDAIGWRRLNRGLDVRQVTAITVAGALPLFLPHDDAAMFERCRDARRIGEYFVLVGHGEEPASSGASPGADDRIARFRRGNLVHAEALAELLDLSPLTHGRVERLLGMMDRLTGDFVALFPESADECGAITRAYASLRRRIIDAMGASNDAEVVRLVQPFEDPASPGEITSLHGLKRYLHQRSLKLAFRLVEGARGTNRTATALVTTDDRVMAAGRAVEYIDFEPAGESGGAPYSVQIVIDAFVHQMLHGVTALPSVRIYCYGNEVQYFVAFRNHPVFIRIDFSPPAGGGMIDLEYYGVSKYELSDHPNLGLDAIRACFERLDFAVAIENTRIHARYDKERARDTADLCARAEAVFRIAPYLMDLDWQVGALDISPGARREVERAWADVLARWGVLPLDQMTTSDRRRVLVGYEYGPTGAVEVPWRGDVPYRDRLTSVSSNDFVADLSSVLEAMGLAGDLTVTSDDLAQVSFERTVLRAIRRRPQSPGGGLPAPEYLARVLIGDDRSLAASACLALLIGQFERLLRFHSIGSINGYDVQRAELVLPGDELTLAVLRDDSGIGRIACFVRDGDSGGPSTDASAFAAILRRRNFPLAVDAGRDADEPHALRTLFGTPSRRTPPAGLPGEFLVGGTRAAGGRAVGLARFRSGRSDAADVEGGILVTPHLTPDDGPFLVRAEGVMATGGGVLSHAGLLAAQFERPALIVGGSWRDTRGLDPRLHIDVTEYETDTRHVGDLEVTLKRHVRAGVLEIRDGDLIELDADDSVARVYGQDREALALHGSLAQLALASARVQSATDPAEVLGERGRQLRAVHLLERLLAQIDRPALMAHAVRELLVGRASAVRGTAPREHAVLVRALLENPAAGVHARGCARAIYTALSQKLASAHAAALREIPAAIDLGGALLPRITTLRDEAAVDATAAALNASGVDVDASVGVDVDGMDRLTADTVRRLRSDSAGRLVPDDPRSAHLLDAIARCDAVIGPDSSLERCVAVLQRAVSERQEQSCRRARGALVVGAADGGLELRPFVGGKAANLAEIEQLAGAAIVPPWFAVSAAALDAVLDGAAPSTGSLREAIQRAAAIGNGDERQRAQVIAALFDSVELPPDLVRSILGAYHELDATAGAAAPRGPGGQLLVAVRSSAVDEDTSSATRAGEFDTFLCVAGDDDLVRRVRRAWAGFWSARAIHGRESLGQAASVSGGLIVQRMVAARTAGVVQTINAADRRAAEIVINAAFGLGAGVVSGSVAADHVIVAKAGLLDGEGPLRFRYATADKRQQVVFDARTGAGTVITDTLYHQRMRPALEYPQLAELARAAARLERAYGYALDIEFAFDAARLWILQARPVPAWFAVVRETKEKYPLRRYEGTENDKHRGHGGHGGTRMRGERL